MKYFEVQKEINAYVIETCEDSFFARILNENNDLDDSVEAEIPLKYVSAGQLDMLIPGAKIVWRIGILNDNGVKKPDMQIRFIKPVPPTLEEIEAGK